MKIFFKNGGTLDYVNVYGNYSYTIYISYSPMFALKSCYIRYSLDMLCMSVTLPRVDFVYFTMGVCLALAQEPYVTPLLHLKK